MLVDTTSAVDRRAPSPPAASAPRSRPWIPVVAVAALALAVRSARVTSESLRVDEAWTVWVADHPPAEVPGILASSDTHPPLSYVAQSLWRVVGTGDLAVRSLSVVASVATVVVVALLARRLAGGRVGLTAGVLLAVSPWHVQHAADARMYALAGLAVAVALTGAVEVVTATTAGRRRVGMATYAAAAVAGLYTHNAVAVTVVAIGVATAVVLARDGDRAALRAWGWANVAVAGLWALWWPSLLGQVGRLDEALAWAGDPSADGVRSTLGAPLAWASDGRPWWAGVWLDVAVVALAVLGARRLGRPGWVLLAAFAALPVVALGLAAVDHTLVDRVLLPSSVAVYPLVAAALWRLGRWVGGLGTLALVVAALPGLLGPQPVGQRSEFERAAQLVAAEATPDTVVVYAASFGQLGIDRYVDLPGPEIGVPADFFADPWGSSTVTWTSLDELERRVAGRDDVWLVSTLRGSVNPDRRIERRLGRTLTPTTCLQLRGIELVHLTAEGERDPACP